MGRGGPGDYPGTFLRHRGPEKFLTPDHALFDELMEVSYKGFIKEPAGSDMMQVYTEALADLERRGIFQYDVTQPMGPNTKCAKTKVTRTLVGEPGITYKYLGLRMFSHPWCEDDANTVDEPPTKKPRIPSKPGVDHGCELMGRLNTMVARRTKRLMKETETTGKRHFNLSLINRMEPLETKQGLKEESAYGMGKVSVSWHADSSLVDHSAIAVIIAHRAGTSFGSAGLIAANSEPPEQPWRIAMRVVHDIEGPLSLVRRNVDLPKRKSVDEGGIVTFGSSGGGGGASMDGARQAKVLVSSSNQSDDEPTPAVVIPVYHGDAFYMLGAFNHHHQHAVLAGDHAWRFSSTHRLVTEEHSYDYIFRLCADALDENYLEAMNQTVWHDEQVALNEVEFDWIRQFFVQGQLHYDLHTWWHRPMRRLLKFWSKLEARTRHRLDQLTAAAANEGADVLTLEDCQSALGCCVVMVGNLTKRQRLRCSWRSREVDHVFKSMPANCKPLPCLQATQGDQQADIDQIQVVQRSLRGVKNRLAAAAKLARDAAKKADTGDCLAANGSTGHDDSVFLSRWEFETSYGDHFETPTRAYVDVEPLLRRIAASGGLEQHALRIYDPYFCTGRMKKLLGKLGYTEVINNNRDFYVDIENRAVPAHDVLLSNPPYSADHKEKLLTYILECQQGRGASAAVPFMLLLPAWSATKAAWRRFLWCMKRLQEGDKSVSMADARALKLGALDAELERAAGAFFVCPAQRYEFKHPDDSGRPEAPFFGIWFCGGWPTESACNKGIKAAEKAFAGRYAADEGDGGMVLRSLAELQERGIVRSEAEARERQLKNPKQRALREKALQQANADRKADPNFKKRKNAKKAKARETVFMRWEDGGVAMTPEFRSQVLANKKACRHFFGLVDGGSTGCNTGAKCRFLHVV